MYPAVLWQSLSFLTCDLWCLPNTSLKFPDSLDAICSELILIVWFVVMVPCSDSPSRRFQAFLFDLVKSVLSTHSIHLFFLFSSKELFASLVVFGTLLVWGVNLLCTKHNYIPLNTIIFWLIFLSHLFILIMVIIRYFLFYFLSNS